VSRAETERDFLPPAGTIEFYSWRPLTPLVPLLYLGRKRLSLVAGHPASLSDGHSYGRGSWAWEP
jgi:hypothetical protein